MSTITECKKSYVIVTFIGKLLILNWDKMFMPNIEQNDNA